jgi:Rv0078B-related antitoxin
LGLEETDGMKKKPRPKARPARTDLAAKLRLVFDLFAAGEDLMIQNLSRSNPRLSPQSMEAKIRKWLQARPGGSLGDSVGRPILRPRP